MNAPQINDYALLCHPDFRGMLETARAEPAAVAALSDWSRERGEEALADWLLVEGNTSRLWQFFELVTKAPAIMDAIGRGMAVWADAAGAAARAFQQFASAQTLILPNPRVVLTPPQ